MIGKMKKGNKVMSILNDGGDDKTPMTRREFKDAKKQARQSGRAIKQKEKLASLSSGEKKRGRGGFGRAVDVASGVVSLGLGVKQLLNRNRYE
jgi:hypothetical protein